MSFPGFAGWPVILVVMPGLAPWISRSTEPGFFVLIGQPHGRCWLSGPFVEGKGLNLLNQVLATAHRAFLRSPDRLACSRASQAVFRNALHFRRAPRGPTHVFPRVLQDYGTDLNLPLATGFSHSATASTGRMARRRASWLSSAATDSSSIGLTVRQCRCRPCAQAAIHSVSGSSSIAPVYLKTVYSFSILRKKRPP